MAAPQTASEIFKGQGFGLGGVPLGNEFAYVTDEIAYATIEAAWNASTISGRIFAPKD